MHTKGPWKIGPRFDDTYIFIESDETFIARTVGGNDEANALLIAAAPDLLAMLELASKYVGKMAADGVETALSPEVALNRINEAIRKAKEEVK